MAAKKKGNGVNSTGRSKTDGQYWSVPFKMIQSLAWRSLSGPALKVYMELRTRYWGAASNGKCHMSLDEAVELLGIGKATANRAFKELQQKGFIVKTKQGHWYGRMANEYAFTDKSLNGCMPTNDWRRWQPSKNRSSVPTRTEKDRNMVRLSTEE